MPLPRRSTLSRVTLHPSCNRAFIGIPYIYYLRALRLQTPSAVLHTTFEYRRTVVFGERDGQVLSRRWVDPSEDEKQDKHGVSGAARANARPAGKGALERTGEEGVEAERIDFIVMRANRQPKDQGPVVKVEDESEPAVTKGTESQLEDAIAALRSQKLKSPVGDAAPSPAKQGATRDTRPPPPLSEQESQLGDPVTPQGNAGDTVSPTAKEKLAASPTKQETTGDTVLLPPPGGGRLVDSVAPLTEQANAGDAVPLSPERESEEPIVPPPATPEKAAAAAQQPEIQLPAPAETVVPSNPYPPYGTETKCLPPTPAHPPNLVEDIYYRTLVPPLSTDELRLLLSTRELRQSDWVPLYRPTRPVPGREYPPGPGTPLCAPPLPTPLADDPTTWPWEPVPFPLIDRDTLSKAPPIKAPLPLPKAIAKGAASSTPSTPISPFTPPSEETDLWHESFGTPEPRSYTTLSLHPLALTTSPSTPLPLLQEHIQSFFASSPLTPPSPSLESAIDPEWHGLDHTPITDAETVVVFLLYPDPTQPPFVALGTFPKEIPSPDSEELRPTETLEVLAHAGAWLPYLRAARARGGRLVHAGGVGVSWAVKDQRVGWGVIGALEAVAMGEKGKEAKVERPIVVMRGEGGKGKGGKGRGGMGGVSGGQVKERRMLRRMFWAGVWVGALTGVMGAFGR